jgi:hypothetical protein
MGGTLGKYPSSASRFKSIDKHVLFFNYQFMHLFRLRERDNSQLLQLVEIEDDGRPYRELRKEAVSKIRESVHVDKKKHAITWCEK